MKYLLTGGAGFIGSHLSEFLQSEGHEVIIIDDFSTGSFDNINVPNHVSVETGPHVIADSVTNFDILNDIVPQVDYVFHLAAVVGVKLVLDKPIKTIETNVEGTQNVLKAANKYRKPVMIFSTSEVYGKSKAKKFVETMDLSMGSIYKERWSYAASKIVDEYLGMAYYMENKLPVTIIRMFNVVGPRQTGHYGMVLPRFVKQALDKEDITVYNTGNQIRTFTHVTDAVETIYRLSQSKKAAGKVFNIGSDQEIKIKDLAVLVQTLLSSRSKIVNVPYYDAYNVGFEDTPRRVPDMSNTTSFTGYLATRTLTDMIRDVARFLISKKIKGKYTFNSIKKR